MVVLYSDRMSGFLCDCFFNMPSAMMYCCSVRRVYLVAGDGEASPVFNPLLCGMWPFWKPTRACCFLNLMSLSTNKCVFQKKYMIDSLRAVVSRASIYMMLNSGYLNI